MAIYFFIHQYKQYLTHEINRRFNIIRLRFHVKLGKNCSVDTGTFIGTGVKIKENTTIGQNVIIKNGVSIGSFVSLCNIAINKNSILDRGVLVMGNNNGRISIGKECYIGPYNILDCSSDIIIHDNVHIAGPSTGLWTHSSAKQAVAGIPLYTEDSELFITKPIEIESNVFIGGNCIIYPGVKIGHHSIITPNSVVIKNIEPFSLVGGVPAVFIKKIKPSS